ncbi:MAG: HAD-IIIA family hydrolase [candidate division Zixibacteria bacterium]|nr:HAD-IIIA family hydrolase [candidate division Zixibacteria bacterium]
MKKKILVIRFSSLGDVILTSAAVLNLKLNFPDSHIVFLTKERFRDLVTLFSGVDEVVTITEHSSLREFTRVLLKLDDYNFDIIVDLHGNLRSWLARKALTAVRRVVYPKRRRERFLAVKRRRLPRSGPHTIDLYNNCLRQLAGSVAAKRPVLTPGGDLGAALSGLDPAREACVVIAPGAAHPNKRWPLTNFLEVASTLKDTHGVRIIWAITAEDRDELDVGAAADSDSLRLVDWPVEKLASVIAAARLTIANDSGIAHLSSAVGTPVLAVFGPTHPALGFAPRGMFDRVAEVEEFCRPCSRHGRKACYREERYCFTRLSAETVAQAAGEMLHDAAKRSPAVFVDRDGTLIVEKHFLSEPDRVELEEGSIEALRVIRRLGYKLVIVSNQSGVARSLFDIAAVESVNRRLLEMLSARGIEVDGIYFCPHYESGSDRLYAIACNCRKPAAGMAEEAADQLGLELRRSYVIGDSIVDFGMGRVIGATPLLVRSGYGRQFEKRLFGGDDPEGNNVFDNLLGAVKYIEGRQRG